MTTENTLTGLEVAVIGMAGRFPGANNLEEFWENLKNGVESLAFLSDEELKKEGINKLLKNPKYIKARGVLEDTEFFDAAFFGYTPLEAELLDPQMRIFHECAFAALEDAGYEPSNQKSLIGLYAGALGNFFWEGRVQVSGKYNVLGWFPSKQLNDKDYMTTRVANKLNLKGPALTIDTACSTSLVAVHMAFQGLLSGDCDMALAGGVTVSELNRKGYQYEEGMLHSPDGHCRAFDAKAKGTNFGSGVGVVVLKRLSEAMADNDHIYAVIKGSSINNDGTRKAAYTAPSIEGQAEVIRTALEMAEVDPDTITYVETHGTGTALGDPVEIEGLKAAFHSGKRHFCRIGSVKTNVGHLETASGAAGFIKTVLALYHRLIPPSLHFETPNPKIDFENSPFIVNTTPIPWKRSGNPLRAGVSSFGIGGTNAHVILEEAPEGTGGLAPLSTRQYQLILLSARTQTALDGMTQNLAEHFKKNPGINFADAAYTLQVGRKIFKHRRMVVGSVVDEAADLLSQPGSGKVKTFCSEEDNRPVVFMFTGLGSQYVNMGRDLYEKEPVFRNEMDRCFEILKPLIDEDIKEILYRSDWSDQSDWSDRSDRSDSLINQTEIAQVVVFIFEYALAKLLIQWGVRPHAMIGYSFGEYAAACLAGVFSLEDALDLVVTRGQLIRETPDGGMVSVPLPKHRLAPLLDEWSLKDECSIAIDNGPSCVVSGPPGPIAALEKRLKEKKYLSMRVDVPRAIHSAMMEPIAGKFNEKLSRMTLKKPGIPYISNVTGTWITGEETQDPGYWGTHLTRTVQFADGMKELLKESGSIFIEIGPGRDISTLAQRHIESAGENRHQVINLVRHPQQDISDVYFLLNRLGRLWLYGQPIDWVGFYFEEKRRRISLPTYPFEGQKYWIHQDLLTDGMVVSPHETQVERKPDMADWFYMLSWKRCKPFSYKAPEIPDRFRWLVLTNHISLSKQLLEQLERKNQDVFAVSVGNRFEKVNHRLYTINPQEDDQYGLLVQDLRTHGGLPDRIIHLWNITPDINQELVFSSLEQALDRGFYSLVHLARAIGDQQVKNDIQIFVVSNGVHQVGGKDEVCPEKASLLGPVRVIPAEFTHLSCRSIDVILPDPGTREEENLVNQLLKEFITGTSHQIIAYRDHHRWVQVFEPVRLDSSNDRASRLKPGGVYLITGGLGGIGYTLAQYLAKQVKAKLVLTGRTPVPPREDWEQRLKTNNNDEQVSHIRKIMDLEKSGSEVLVFSAEVENLEQMQTVITRTKEYFGRINGVIHSAGVADGAMIQFRTRESSEKVFSAKIKGTLVLDRLLKDTPLDFFVFCSSIAALLSQIGQVGYCAANNFLDAYAHRKFFREGTFTVSVNWDRWQNIGVAAIIEKQHKQLTGEELTGGITPEEGAAALGRILAEPLPQVIVSPKELEMLIQQLNRFNTSSLLKSLAGISSANRLYERPQLDTEYAAPLDETQQTLAKIWENLFGFQPIGIHDDFFEMGGDSLRAMVVLSKIHKEIDVEIPISEFFSRPTIEKLSEYIGGSEKSTYSAILPVEEKEYYPLSSAQKRLFILQQVAPDSTVYNEYLPEVFERDLQKDKLEEIFRKLIERHESLRTSFELVKGEPVQRIHYDVHFEIQYRDLCSSHNEDQAPGSIVGNFVKPFDLSKVPLLRVGLIKVRENRNILLVDVHHIICDGISIDLIIREFSALVDDKKLPELPIRYKDYVQWQNSESIKQRIMNQEEYWLKRFQGEVPVLNLSIDYPRPGEQDFTGKTRGFNIGKEQTQLLQALAVQEEATLFMKILTIFYIFLFKICSQEDIVVGIPTAGRRHSDLENIIGMFVNSLPLRNFPRADMTFKELLKEVKEQTLKDFEHQEYPFEELIDKLNVDRDISRNPVFEVMFILYSMKTGETDEQSFNYEKNVSRFDLTLQASEAGENLFFRFEYCSKLFKEETIEKFVGYFREIISVITHHPWCKLWEIEIMAAEEKNRVLYEFNSTAVEYPKSKTIDELFAEQAERTPDHIAVIGMDHGPWSMEKHLEGTGGLAPLSASGSITYRELNKKASQLAYYLREKGVEPGNTIVPIMVERTTAMMTGFLGIMKAGGAYLPLDPEYPRAKIKYILEKSGAKMLLTQENLIANNNDLVVEREMINIFAENMFTGNKQDIENKNRAKRNHPAADIAYVIYTSGSTGNPKGVVVRHQNAVNFIVGMAAKIDFSPGKTILALTTISFDIFFLETLLPVTRGLKLVIANEAQQSDPQLLPGVITGRCVDMVQVTPSRVKLLLSLKEGLNCLGGVKELLVGGEAFPPHLFASVKEKFPGKIYNVYGPTETTIWSTVKDLSNCQAGELNIGSPIANTRIYIVDRFLQAQPLGIAGELSIGGDGVAAGYLNNPELTAEKFDH
ncbi:MAG: SDR family NAD(P)-dependent oxidoreductase, partial [Candidatus Aminicenantes bacterium]